MECLLDHLETLIRSKVPIDIQLDLLHVIRFTLQTGVCRDYEKSVQSLLKKPIPICEKIELKPGVKYVFGNYGIHESMDEGEPIEEINLLADTPRK